MEVPVLTRQISANVSKQYYGDCFAHAIARVVVKAFRKQFPVEFDIQENISETCNTLYQHTNEFFYDCNETNKCMPIPFTELKTHCNPVELNSIVLYMYIYSIIVNKYGCEGGNAYDTLNYIVHGVLYNEEVITSTCFIHPDLCDIITPILISNIHNFLKNREKLVYILKYNDYKYIGYPAYSTMHKKIMMNTVVNPAIYFFDSIKYAIDNELYLVLTINGSFIKWKEANPGKTYTVDIAVEDNGHAATIVNYDYSSTKVFTIKNTWEKETAYTNISEEELLALSQNTWRPINICYLDFSRITVGFAESLDPKYRTEFIENVAKSKKESFVVGGKSKRRKRYLTNKLKFKN
jgi:hypothetical protein